MPEAVDAHHQRAAGALDVAPGVAALDLAGLRHDDGADFQRVRSRGARLSGQSCASTAVPCPGCEYTSNTCDMRFDRTEAGAGAAAGREPVAQALRQVGDARALVEPEESDAADVAALQRLHDQLAAAAVLDQVAADFHRDQRGAPGILLVEALARRQRRRPRAVPARSGSIR